MFRNSHTLTRTLFAFILFCALSLSAYAQHVSGKVQDPNGDPIFKAYVTELDNTNRICNQTTTDRAGNFTMAFTGVVGHYICITADGFQTRRQKIDAQDQIFKFNMSERPKSKLSLLKQQLDQQAGKKRRYVRSNNLLCGRSGGQEVPWMVEIEQINDTLFTLQMPITALNANGAYPEGRTMVFLDKNDYHMLMGYCAEEAIPMLGNPADEDVWNSIGKEITNEKVYARNSETMAFDSTDPIYYYPEFLFTLDELQLLCKEAENISYLVIDVETGDNYWNVYPMEDFGKELTKILNKLTKKKK